MSISLSRSMSSVYFNSSPSSFPDLNEDQHLHHLFLSPNPNSFFGEFHHHHHHQEVKVEYISQSRLNDDPKPPSSCSSFEREDGDGSCEGTDNSKWIPSKMRIVQKMMNSNCSSETDKPLKYTVRFQDNNSSQSTIRVCSDCNTTTTPLWRSGPKGPKSLCNACGIRQRKARRAMAAAAEEAAMGNGGVVGMDQTSTKSSSKVQNKEKKLRTGHVSEWKKLRKSSDHHQPLTQKPKISFKNFGFSLNNNNGPSLDSVFPQDVEQAAILLMELSCGFVCGETN